MSASEGPFARADRRAELLLKLLFILSALLSGLTGVMSGERGVERSQIEQAAAVSALIEHAGEVAGAAEHAARTALPRLIESIAPTLTLAERFAPARAVLSITGSRRE